MNEVERAFDELYATPPETFTKTRDAIATRLKKAGETDAAAKIASLRRPTRDAYVLNQLARRHPDELAALVDVGRDLARAQRRALRGHDAAHDLREAIGRQRDAVRELVAKAASLMADLGVATRGHLDTIAGALQAALVDPAVGVALEEGRLSQAPAPAAGFLGAAPLSVTAPAEPLEEPAARGPGLKKARASAEREQRKESARRAAQEARARADELHEQAIAARRRADELRAGAERAERDAKQAEKEAAKAARSAERLASKSRAA